MSGRIKSVRFPKALDSNGREIFIHDAPKGRKGYRCTGCKRSVEAVKPILDKPQPYFRHVATDISIDKSECTWASETYRHKIAKEVLQEERSIRVPRILVDPPKGIDGDPKVLAAPTTISAYRVDVEKSFYINNQGLLRYGPKTDESISEPDKHCLIVPDVIFFNSNNEPILFIELVATHDIDDIKLAKIRALKIDTISVRLPFESAEAIRKCFKTTERTKWVYNNEREQANYFNLPGVTVKRVPGSDEYAERISYESTRCRKIRIGNLIRGIRRGLEAGGFDQVTESLRRKIDAVESELSWRRTIENQLDLEASELFRGRREKIGKKQEQLKRVNAWLEERYKQRRRDIDLRGAAWATKRRRDIKDEEKFIEELYQKVRERYERKGGALETEERDINRRIASCRDESKLDGRAFIGKQEQIERDIDRMRTDLESLLGKMGSVQQDFDRARDQIDRRFRGEESGLEREYRQTERRENIYIEQFKREQDELSGRIESTRADIIARFDQLRRIALDAASRRDTEGSSSLSGKIKELVSSRGILSDYSTSFNTFERYREALRFINSETFKIFLKARGTI